MSTRATYRFTRAKSHAVTDWTPDMFVYVHYDGYEAGAACYFWAMHHAQNRRGGFADHFLRAVEQAELTQSHELHGDTEFRYTLYSDGSLLAEKAYGGLDTKTWHRIYAGHYAEFINANLPKEPFAGPGKAELIMLHELQYGRKQWLTLTELEARIAEEAKQFALYEARFPGMTGNLASLGGALKASQEAYRVALATINAKRLAA